LPAFRTNHLQSEHKLVFATQTRALAISVRGFVRYFDNGYGYRELHRHFSATSCATLILVRSR